MKALKIILIIAGVLSTILYISILSPFDEYGNYFPIKDPSNRLCLALVLAVGSGLVIRHFWKRYEIIQVKTAFLALGMVWIAVSILEQAWLNHLRHL